MLIDHFHFSFGPLGCHGFSEGFNLYWEDEEEDTHWEWREKLSEVWTLGKALSVPYRIHSHITNSVYRFYNGYIPG